MDVEADMIDRDFDRLEETINRRNQEIRTADDAINERIFDVFQAGREWGEKRGKEYFEAVSKQNKELRRESMEDEYDISLGTLSVNGKPMEDEKTPKVFDEYERLNDDHLDIENWNEESKREYKHWRSHIKKAYEDGLIDGADNEYDKGYKNGYARKGINLKQDETQPKIYTIHEKPKIRQLLWVWGIDYSSGLKTYKWLLAKYDGNYQYEQVEGVYPTKTVGYPTHWTPISEPTWTPEPE